MEENSALPESIVLTGESELIIAAANVDFPFLASPQRFIGASEEDEGRWILLLGQWLHQGGGCYRRLAP